MKSNYKRIGDFIELVDERNTDLKVDTLVGLSINKIFIPSVANTVGTNMKRYKIIRKNQFACSTMQVRRDKKMPVALLKEHDKAIISQAYPVFQVIDENVLLSEYLMMWMSREEFDRHACFLAVGGVRGSLEWEDFLDMEIPVPSIEKQREIVTEYNAVVNRIKLNEKLNEKLEETAQTIYRQWFEEFEFPIPKELAEEMGTPELEGKPYKSSGGEMVYNEELEKEIPMGWGVELIGALVDNNSENIGRDDDFKRIRYLDTGNITKNKIDEIKILDLESDLLPSRAKRKVKHNDIIYSTVRPNLKHYGLLKEPEDNMIVSTGFAVLSCIDERLTPEIIYLFLISEEIETYLHAKAETSVSTYPSIKSDDLLNLKTPVPNWNNSNSYKHLELFFNSQNTNNIKTSILNKLSKLLLERISTFKELENAV